MPVAALVRAFVEPGVGLTEGHGHRGPDVARFIGRVMSEPDPQVRQIFAEQVEPVEGRYLAAFGRALPGLDEDGVLFAYTSMVGLLSVYLSGAFATPDWASKQDKGTAARVLGAVDRERLVEYITGGILAILPAEANATP